MGNKKDKSDFSFHFTFKAVEESQKGLIYSWTALDHVKEWLHGQGLKNTYASLEASFKGSSEWQHWLAYEQDVPFGYLITSSIKHEPDESSAITLDVFIWPF